MIAARMLKRAERRPCRPSRSARRGGSSSSAPADRGGRQAPRHRCLPLWQPRVVALCAQGRSPEELARSGHPTSLHPGPKHPASGVNAGASRDADQRAAGRFIVRTGHARSLGHRADEVERLRMRLGRDLLAGTSATRSVSAEPPCDRQARADETCAMRQRRLVPSWRRRRRVPQRHSSGHSRSRGPIRGRSCPGPSRPGLRPARGLGRARSASASAAPWLSRRRCKV